jgi:epoxyqueuosine reductase
VALGNALRAASPEAAVPWQAALQARLDHPSSLVREHVAWALQQSPTEPTEPTALTLLN